MASEVTFIIDAGARYGIHPSWKKFNAAMRYYMFEPDPEHAPALAQKYQAAGERVEVIQSALGRASGKAEINVFRHRGLSGVLKPHPKSVWFSVFKAGQGEMVDTYSADMTSVDDFAGARGIAVDFLKCDTEGTELEVLLGAADQLKSGILGVYSEVSLGAVFEGDSSFGEVDQFLRSQGFMLLALDVEGRGSPLNKFYAGNRFGVLEGADAIWIRAFDWISENSNWSENEKVTAYLKLSAFCFAHDVTDVALQHLIDARRFYPASMQAQLESGLSKCTQNYTQNLFKKLDEHMAFSSQELDETYRNIFASDRKLLHEFYEDLYLNPD